MENSRDSIVLAADLPDYQRTESRDPERAAELTSLFHQILGECVYASGGTVHDTIGSIAIAELPDPTAALRCVENLHKRIELEAASEKDLSPRAALTSGEVHDKDFSIAGQAVQNALSILDALQKDQILVSSSVLARAGVSSDAKPLITLGESGYFALPLGDPVAHRQPSADAVPAGAPAVSPGVTGDTAPGEAGSPRKTWVVAAVTAVVVLALTAVALFLFRSGTAPVETASDSPEPAVESGPRIISLSIGDLNVSSDVELDDSRVAAASALMTALIGSAEDVEIVARATNRVGADVRMIVPAAGQSPEDVERTAGAVLEPLPLPDAPPAEPHVVPWIERSGERFEGAPSELDDVWSIVIPVVRWTGEQLDFETDQMVPAAPELRNAFADVVESGSSQASDADLAALHAALETEPEFLPGWLALSSSETENPRLTPLILDGLRNVSKMMPAREDLARALGKRELDEGTLAGAVEAFSRVRAEDRDDEQAVRVLALAALAAHQGDRFRTLVEASDDPRLHMADFEVSEGRINDAVKKYYETEKQVPDNPFLSFKIGRIAVLRRSLPIAQIEIDKLSAQGVEPQRSLLRAYIAADAGNRADAEAALAEALQHAEWSDSPSFHAAEIHSILRDARKSLAAIERSVERREPMMHAITTNPLFGYLTNESRYRESLRRLLEHQRSVGSSLATHS